MRRRVALARACAPRPACVRDVDAVRSRHLEPVPDRAPRTHVLRLLLRPDELAELGVRGHQGGRGLDWEGVELLDPGDGNGPCVAALLMPLDVVVELAG